MTILLQYSMTADSLNPTTTGDGVSGGILTDSGNLNSFGALSPGYASDPIVRADVPAGNTTIAASVGNDMYWSFTITPDGGFSIDFDTITFNGARAGASAPRGYGIRWSIDAFGSNLKTADFGTVNPNWTNVSQDISSAIGIVSVTTFRIYCYGAVFTGTDYDDITINGEAVKALVGGFSGTMIKNWIFMRDMWNKHNEFWKPKGGILVPG